jgi:hypothetical protein
MSEVVLQSDGKVTGTEWATKQDISNVIATYNTYRNPSHPDRDLPPGVDVPAEHLSNRETWVEDFWNGVLETMSDDDIGQLDNT